MPELLQGVPVKYNEKDALESLKRQYAFLSEEIPGLEEKYEVAKDLLEKKLKELNPLLDRLKALENTRATLLTQIANIEKETEDAVASRISEIESLDKKIVARNSELAKEQKDLKDARGSLSRRQTDLDVEKGRHSIKVAELQSQKHVLETRLNKRETDLSVTQARIDERLESVNKAEQELKGYQERFSWQQNEVERRSQELDDLLKGWHYKEKDLTRLVDAERLKLLEYKGNMKKKEDELNDLRIKLSKQEKWINDKEIGLKATKAKLIEQQSKLKEHIKAKKIGFDWREVEL